MLVEFLELPGALRHALLEQLLLDLHFLGMRTQQVGLGDDTGEHVVAVHDDDAPHAALLHHVHGLDAACIRGQGQRACAHGTAHGHGLGVVRISRIGTGEVPLGNHPRGNAAHTAHDHAGHPRVAHALGNLREG